MMYDDLTRDISHGYHHIGSGCTQINSFRHELYWRGHGFKVSEDTAHRFLWYSRFTINYLFPASLLSLSPSIRRIMKNLHEKMEKWRGEDFVSNRGKCTWYRIIFSSFFLLRWCMTTQSRFSVFSYTHAFPKISSEHPLQYMLGNTTNHTFLNIFLSTQDLIFLIGR